MNLQEALATIEPSRRGSRCTVAQLVDDLDDDDRRTLVAAMDDPRIQTRVIVEALKQLGHNMSTGVLARHRRRAGGAGCRCPL